MTSCQLEALILFSRPSILETSSILDTKTLDISVFRRVIIVTNVFQKHQL